MRIAKAIGFWLLMTASVPFAFWFWLYVVDIGSVPFGPELWTRESWSEIKKAGTSETEGVTMVATLSYTTAVRCYMTGYVTRDGNEAMVSMSYQIESPWVISFLDGHALYGCMGFAADALRELADEEDAAQGEKL